ncbi:hypothetical protein HRG_003825 [Hirsutella rhossiliensis]|uniref:N-acetyltransferase domain-containing protein n=1 Tax=Hirsutella rhossiliensis TaxID=111463 RepID=A0A9P8SL18_9HYPO|nr:uncharacterized protein HRG_03825 [Hirsutella rhossiliensis]KAH0965809.1 hypothetical protein HRG_03825 [Hirsutella rhossiliensis]
MEPGVRQLDLSKCGPGFVSDRVGVVSGLRSSAAFFTFLRANLVLTPSAISSNCNTPYLEPCSPHPYPHYHHHQLPSEPPSPLATSSSSPLAPTDDIPPLLLDTLSTPDDRAHGLRLVADSVTQMEHRAVRILLFHPLCLALVTAAWTLAYRFAYLSRGGSAGLALALCTAVTTAYLVAVRLATLGYVPLAQAIDSSWLGPESDQVVMIGARRGGLLVGALVLHLEPSPCPPCSSPKRRGRNRSASLRGGKGVIRAWTTHVHHRGQGIGRDLLLAAVRMAKDRCGRDARVGFAKEHANSAVLLPSFFAAPFRRDEFRAARALEGAAAEWETTKKRKW